jgi:DNA-binding NtrC family response regulator
MSLPALVLLTPDRPFAAQLSAALASEVEIHVRGSLKEAATDFPSGTTTCVADFRLSAGGGHGEAQFLENLSERFGSVRLVLITATPCSEPIDRYCACHPVTRIDGTPDVNVLAALLRPDECASAPPPRELPVPAAKAAEGSTVLKGLTRRFETQTAKVKQMLSDLEVAAKHDVTVLLIGETGAGKTFLSRLIHEISPRHDEPFLPVACGALPADLIESELFGHVRGAFTSAHADKEGKFLAAGRGTILLDEIDVLGPDQQVKLLRVIESGEFEPVGSNRTYRSQARLIVASNLELQPLVQQGRFRPDLYYRLNMLKFEVPPLRARKPDIIPLAERFVHELSLKHGIHIDRIDDSLYTALYQYPWPGNVRELENVIQRAVIYCHDGVLTAQQLPSYILLGVAGPTNDASVSLEGYQSSGSATNPGSLGKQIGFTERDIIEQALFKNNYSRTSTAKSLGISRVTLYNKMKKYGMSK